MTETSLQFAAKVEGAKFAGTEIDWENLTCHGHPTTWPAPPAKVILWIKPYQVAYALCPRCARSQLLIPSSGVILAAHPDLLPSDLLLQEEAR